MNKRLGVTSSMSTAFHPQTDGQTERTNQEIEAYLRIYCSNHPETWTEHLPLMEFSHNNQVHSVTKQTPFVLLLGYQLRAIPYVIEYTNIPSLSERLKQLNQQRSEALAAHELAHALMAQRIQSKFKLFKEGDLIWLKAKNINLGVLYWKLKLKQKGLFSITQMISL